MMRCISTVESWLLIREQITLHSLVDMHVHGWTALTYIWYTCKSGGIAGPFFHFIDDGRTPNLQLNWVRIHGDVLDYVGTSNYFKVQNTGPSLWFLTLPATLFTSFNFHHLWLTNCHSHSLWIKPRERKQEVVYLNNITLISFEQVKLWPARSEEDSKNQIHLCISQAEDKFLVSTDLPSTFEPVRSRKLTSCPSNFSNRD